MKTVIIVLFISGIIWSCGNKDSGEEVNNLTKTPFEQFVDSMPLIRLPFELSTSDEIQHVNLNSEHIPEGAALVGKLQSKNGTHFIIYSYPADIRLPILEIYNSTGEKINEILLFDYVSCPLTSNGYSKFIVKSYNAIYKETACDSYDSRIDRDTIYIENLLKND